MGEMEHLRKSRILPDLTVSGLELVYVFPKKPKEKHIAQWEQKEVLKLHAERHNRRTCKIFTADKDYLKVIADARLKLEKQIALAMLCIEKDDSRGETSSNCNFN